MRICLYTETALPKIGGQELVVDALARQYLDAGHEPIVLAPHPRSSIEVNDLSLPYRVVRHWRFLSTRRLVGWYYRWITRLHRQLPLDVIHCHSTYPCGYLAALARQKINIPVVLTSHGGDVRAGNPRLDKPGLAQRTAWAIRQADARIAISRFTADAYRRLAPDVGPIDTIANGVHLDQLTATRPERPLTLDADLQPGQYVLFLGRLSRRKGVDLLLQAWAQLPAGLANLPLVVAGDGDQKATLIEQAQRLGLPGRVRFVGAVAGGAKTWLLQNARLLCLPSRDWEAFPLVVLEGYAAGCPIVGTRIPGLADLIQPGETGWLIDPESPTALTAALTEALAQADRLQTMRATVQRVAREYAWSDIARRHLDLYRRVIRQRTETRAA